MKKILKVCAVALSMALLFASCANDSTPAPDYYGIAVPEAPESIETSNSHTVKDGLTAINVFMDPIISDFGCIFLGDELSTGIAGNSIKTESSFMKAFNKIGLMEKFNKEKEKNATPGSFAINLAGNYKADSTLFPNNTLNIKINNGTLGYSIKTTNDTDLTLNAYANMLGNLKFDLTSDDYANIITSSITNKIFADKDGKQYTTVDNAKTPLYLRKSRILSLAGNIAANGNANINIKPLPETTPAESTDPTANKLKMGETYIDSMSGNLSTMINLSGLFDTAYENDAKNTTFYKGILNIRGKLSVPDLNKFYTAVEAILAAGNKTDATPEEINKAECLTNFVTTISAEKIDTETLLGLTTQILTFADELNLKFLGQISISDTNGRNPQNIAFFENFEDAIIFISNFAK